MKIIRLFWQMLRPRVALMLVLFACLGMSYHGHIILSNWRSLLIVFVLASWYVHATTVNDVSDVEIDKINLQLAKGRPLVHKQATTRQLWQLNALAGIVALGGSLILGLASFVIIIVGLVLNYAYSLPPTQLSHKGYVAPLLLPLGYVVIPYLLGSFSVGATYKTSITRLLLGLYLAFIGRIVLKDLRDVVGDKKYSKRTLMVMYGKRVVCLVSAMFWIAGNVILLRVIPHVLSIVLPIELLFALILICLFKISVAKTSDTEQLNIGLLALAANGILIALIAMFLTYSNVTVAKESILLITCIFAATILRGLLHPEQVVLGYRG